jgi:opacity protein-like surface antigen
MKLAVFSSAMALVLGIPAVAAAQTAQQAAPAAAPAASSACPPGSWFCAPPPESQAAPAGKTVNGLQPLPEAGDEAPAAAPAPARKPAVTYAPAPATPPPVVVYQPPPPVVIERTESPAPYEYAPPPRKYPGPPKEWGLNLHLEGAALGSGANHNASMGGLGAGLRYKPARYVGIEGNLDFVGGHGYIGDQRSETALSFNALLFVNPRDRAQVYFLGGFGWAWAHSQNDPSDPSMSQFDNHYSYFGAQAGIGLELRLTRVLAFNIDFRGFVRSRTDQLAQTQPEFSNNQGQTTNTSGGGLLTGGMTLYF